MKSFKTIITAMALLMAAATATAVDTTHATCSNMCKGPKCEKYAIGADVSWLTQMEAEGLTFHSRGDNTPKECMQLLRDDCGINSVRLRVWVDPVDGWNAIDDVVAKAKRANDLGLRTMIDFHFSDSWADPGQQHMPKAWEGFDIDGLCKAVAEHVTATLTALKEAGVTPEWVQIGNETTPGMMLPVGDIDAHPEQYTALNNAGYDAAKAVFPDIVCIVHLDGGQDQWRYDRMFDALEANGGRYDMIGMSVYPFWAEQAGETGGWQKVAADTEANINHLRTKYGKPVMICEIGMPYNEAEACKELIERMMATDVEGIFYWEPQAPAGHNGGYTLGCFDNGAPTVALDAFKNRGEKAPTRISTRLTDGWEFIPGGVDSGNKWQSVTIPHDWAIYGPFDRNNDLQCVAVEQNGETEETWKTGRTGGLPFIGKGAYRRTIEIPSTDDGSTYTLVFDGAMSNAEVSVNGRHAITWPYGYNSFYVNIDSLIHEGTNDILVELENFDQQSRWYPGAGLYRNVHLVKTDKVHIPVWGTYVTTPTVNPDFATIRIEMEIEGAKTDGQWVDVSTDILDPSGKIVASTSDTYVCHGQPEIQNLTVSRPELWSPESPSLYTAVTRLSVEGRQVDEYVTRFGIRRLEYIPEKGFFLNGKPTKFKGVCNHHDLGPLGAAINESALRHQVALLKDMGANAIRTSHNMPAPELVRICDEMGMMLMLEPFDDWGFRPKSPNGYGKVFNEWAERDVTNMVKQYRSNPSVVMWSIGNEVPSQWGADGVGELMMLQNLVHSLDPTRPVTCGMDQIGAVLDNGFASSLDIPGFNYKPQHYDRAYAKLPQKLILGSETASTVSSRGVYFTPVEYLGQEFVYHDNNQSNSYDNENCSWSNTPDIDFMMDDDREWVIGQFVWTGFDYLGEPSPYDTDAWPSHSSYFGIIDLASIPKDRYYLYRSIWNTEDATLHVLPHWTHPGKEGESMPVYVYTSYPEAELFVNGESMGRMRKLSREEYESSADPIALQRRYRLIWDDVTYQPGEITVVAYSDDGNEADRVTVKTAGKPHHIVATPNRTSLKADGEDLVYITIQVADKDGNIVPTANNRIDFKVGGAGTFEATANGDPTCLDSFQAPSMPLFSGAATAISRTSTTPGSLTFEARAKGLKPAKISIPVTK